MGCAAVDKVMGAHIHTFIHTFLEDALSLTHTHTQLQGALVKLTMNAAFFCNLARRLKCPDSEWNTHTHTHTHSHTTTTRVTLYYLTID